MSESMVETIPVGRKAGTAEHLNPLSSRPFLRAAILNICHRCRHYSQLLVTCQRKISVQVLAAS